MRTRGTQLALSLLLAAVLPAAYARSDDPTAWCTLGGTCTPIDPIPASQKCDPQAGGPAPYGGAKCCTSKGSPCWVATGGYSLSASDLTLPTSGFPLAVSRQYESSRQLDGAFGRGWMSSLGARIQYTTYLFSAPSTYRSEATVTMP